MAHFSNNHRFLDTILIIATKDGPPRAHSPLVAGLIH
jgi:hypothetical protein